jgi:translation elongation factor EF-G
MHKRPLLVEIAIEPKLEADRASEVHLDSKIDILKRVYKVDAYIGPARVAYREKITRSAMVDYTYKKQTGGHDQFARIKIVAEPAEPGTGFSFENQVVGGSVLNEFILAVENGLKGGMSSGVLAGFPVVDVKVSLVDGVSHDVDSSPMAFEICARAAMREALQKGGSVLLEPIMKVEVVTPEDYSGSVISAQFASRSDSTAGHAWQRQRHHGNGSARQHVLLRRQSTLHESGARHVHDVV